MTKEIDSMRYNTKLMRGTVLWRPVIHTDDALTKCEIGHVELAETRREEYLIGRILFSGTNFLFEPEVYDPDRKGMVVFVKRDVPQNWTHLKITGMCDKAAFAEAAKPFDMDLYLAWRSQIARVTREFIVAPLDYLRRNLCKYPPPEIRIDEYRKIVRDLGEGRMDETALRSTDYSA